MGEEMTEAVVRSLVTGAVEAIVVIFAFWLIGRWK